MRVVALTTGTNNVPPIIDSLVAAGHEVCRIVYDVIEPADMRHLPALVDRANPDWVVYVGALPGHHPAGSIPDVEVLAQIGAARKMAHLCFDGGEPLWWPWLQRYYDEARFSLQVSIDGVRLGPIGDRGLVLLGPIDVSLYDNPPWDARPIWCGFSGGLHGGRQPIFDQLIARGVITYRPRDVEGDHAEYRAFLSACRIGVNRAETGGGTGQMHVKHRVGGELPAAGCVVLESRGSPLSDWFQPGVDYLEYEHARNLEDALTWVAQHPFSAMQMASRMRAKVAEQHSPKVFWSRVGERLGFGRALIPTPELPWRYWEAPKSVLPPRLAPPPTVAVPLLLEAHDGINFVRYADAVYAVPQSLGPVHIHDPRVQADPHIRKFPDVATAKAALGITAPTTEIPRVFPHTQVHASIRSQHVR